MVKQKHFVDIEVLREFDEDLGGGLCKRNNCGAFQKGDTISITEKIDGSNASMTYNPETGELDAYSRKQPLAFDNTLAGFWNFVHGLNAEEYKDLEGKFLFGEWLRKNKIVYDNDKMLKWYVYSIYDTVAERWLPQEDVKAYCKKHGLEYVHEFYYGPFISWEHCRSFCNSPNYGDRQEGVVVRNIDALARGRDERLPHILKIVNKDFQESTKHREKVVDPEKERARAEAEELMSTIVTKNRVEKMLLKLRDEGILPDELTPKDMGVIAKNLPKRIYEDCIKEEPEIMEKCGELGSKICSSRSMYLVRNIVMGA